MEVKKRTFFDNFRLKPKLLHMKKPRKKAAAKQGKKLAYRRSISVPDLRPESDEALSFDNSMSSNASEALFFGISPGLSDTDSIASGSNYDGLIMTEKLNDPVPQPRRRVHTDTATTAMYRISAPEGIQRLYEEIDAINSASGNKINITNEGLYAQVDKKTFSNVPNFNYDPVPVPRTIYTNPVVYSPKPDIVERDGFNSKDTQLERAHLNSISAALNRVSSFGEQVGPYTEKKTVIFEQKNPSSDKGTPPVTKKAPADRLSLTLDTAGTPLEGTDGSPQDSSCDTPNKDQINMFWTEDSEGLDQESCYPLFTKDLSMEEALLEKAQSAETMDELAELSKDQCEFDAGNGTDPLDYSFNVTSDPDVQIPIAAQRYLLNITLKQGKNLVVRHKRSGTSDPYVKFKIEGKVFYKSKVVYKSLNPRWNESFSHPLRDREHPIELRIYDKNRTADESMGSSFISLKNLELYKTYDMELHVSDPKGKEDDMGVILVDVRLMFRDATIKRGPRWPQKKNKQNQATPAQRPVEALKNQLKSQMWTGVLGITLVEGQNLPQCGHGDVYVRFRLNEQKYKSKNLCIQTNPQWREQFDFNQFEDNQEPLQVEMCCKRGRKGEESWGMFEIDLSRLPLNESQLYTHVLNPGKGRLVFLATLRPCWGVSISDIETATLEKPVEKDEILQKFSLKNSYKCMEEIGFLQVKVIKANDLPATDLNGKSNSFCVVELGNCKLQTHTVYKSVNPEWSKAFTFPIKDMHDIIELTVLDENGDKTPNFLGKVAVPLLTVNNGEEISLVLKKEDLIGGVSRGTITLVLDVIYNRVRAGLKTFKPKETKLIEENLKFSKKVLAQNIYRVRKISTAVLYTLQYIKSCFQWESTQRSLIAFLIFLVTVWYWELFMLPLFLLLLLGWQYYQLSAGKANSNPDLVNMSMGDDEEEDEKEASKKGLMDKIHMVQEVVLAVQTILEEIADIGEEIKNIFNWSVPFLSYLACLVLCVATTLLYLIPFRYIVLIWGVNKFTKKLRNPYNIDNNEIRNFLKRVPSDVQKVQYSALRAPTSQNQPRKKR
ncbi:multiple C2 and transmembrane domain-containing protein 2 isoform X2 [Antennarius striatus]|uniref:multiple C2 and transmembrane domain-containing protein 2 isoform X2 n=1 Tax=Antennarius striatus TaxID=241820 RepID=UPI0035AF644A